MDKVILVDDECHIIPDDTTDFEQHTPATDCWCNPFLKEEFDADHPDKKVFVHLLKYA